MLRCSLLVFIAQLVHIYVWNTCFIIGLIALGLHPHNLVKQATKRVFGRSLCVKFLVLFEVKFCLPTVLRNILNHFDLLLGHFH